MYVPWGTLKLSLIQPSLEQNDNHATNNEFVSIFVTNLGKYLLSWKHYDGFMQKRPNSN